MALIMVKFIGTKVLGVSKYIPTEPSHFEAAKIGDLVKDIRLDILDISELKKIVYKFEPDFVFHFEHRFYKSE